MQRIDGQGVKEMRVDHANALGLKTLGQYAGEPMNALGDAFKPVGTVIDGVKTGHIGQQNLRGADV